MKQSTEIEIGRLVREARASEHGEAYQQMGSLDGVSVGVGARLFSRSEPTYFIEFTVPVCPGPEVDLRRLAWMLEVLKWLEERGYSLTCEYDMSFSCELTLPCEELIGEYNRAVSMLAQM